MKLDCTLVVALFINPIGASEIDPGCIEFKPGSNPVLNHPQHPLMIPPVLSLVTLVSHS